MSRFNSLVVCAIFAMFAVFHLAADTATVNGITWTYTISNGEASLGGGSSNPAVPKSTTGALVIPSTLNNYPVTSIGWIAFHDCTNLTRVTIPSSVANIGDYAFWNCTNLTSVTIPNSVTNIGRNAFYQCYNLMGVTIPSDVTCVNEETFCSCRGLTNVTIPSSVTSIGESAFESCVGLTSVTIPNSVTNIGWDAFEHCRGLTSVTIPDSVTSIGQGAFAYCYELKSVVIGNGVRSIGASAFLYCTGLSAVYITDISAWCGISFAPASLGRSSDANPLTLGHNLYLNGELLVNLVIPDGVTSIGNYAFYNCSGLTGVNISDVAAWCGIIFMNPEANPLSLVHELHLDGALLADLVVPDGVMSIGSYAFYTCTNFTSVTIPNSVTSIAATAFYGCSGLTNVTIPSRWALSSLFANSYTKILSVNVPSGSTSVVNGAFKGCVALEDVSIPDTVTSIGDEAFYNCSSLQQLTLPDGVTSYGVNCFEGCPAYTRALYRALFSGSSGGGSPLVVTTVVQQVEAPYALSSTAADRAIASVAVSSDCSIGSFVLKDGKVYDTMLYVSNTADHEVSLSLPFGYVYKTIKGATPLTIPASSQCIISITRVNANTFLVMREELDDVQ